MADNFHLFATAVEKRLREMSTGELFTVDAGDLFATYLAAFPEGANPVFRVRTEHDCSCCKNFVRNLGKVVSLAGGKVSTVWDIAGLPSPYDVVASKLNEVVCQLPIESVYRTKEGRYGAPKTNELRDGTVHQWHHLFGDVPQRNRSANPERDRGDTNTVAQVFRRGLDELAISDLETVLDLIDSNSLYRGAEHRRAVEGFLSMRRAYDAAPDKSLFVWMNIGNPAARFRNTVIGTLVTDLSAGVPIDDAVRMFESKVAPMNYKRPTALITPKMIDQAVAKLAELGLESAVQRRFARLADVSVNNVLFVDNSVKGRMKGGLTGLLMESVRPVATDIKHAESITVDDFLARVVPQASSIDLLLKNAHLSNFMSVTAPVDPNAGRLFKWVNGFAWSYDGDVADSIKERVKRAGGNIDAALRVSLAWFNRDDLDLHATAPGQGHIYFGDKKGVLDVDMNAFGNFVRDPVENLAWSQLRDGVYRIWVNQYTRRETVDIGFTLEVASGGRVEQFTYDKAVNGDIPCMDITVARGLVTGIAFAKHLKAGSTSQSKWGVDTETLVPVDTLMASPNHWDDQAVGNKHWFFILKGCRNPDQARGIYNEFLDSRLEPHRKVFEVLGAKSKCPPADEQLSGVGFSSARGDKAIVVVKGNRINKAFEIKF